MHYPVVYFFASYLPRSGFLQARAFKRWTLKQELWNAEAGVRNIGNPHQYVTLGNVLIDVGQLDQAVEAFLQAHQKDPKNPHALWGLASVEMQQKQYAQAKEHLQKLMILDPDYKSGEASLLHGKVLYELQDWDGAKVALEKDVQYWSHPESSLLLAIIYIQEGKQPEARACLEKMIFKVKASPMYHYRRHQHIIRKAEKLLKTL